MIRIVKVVAHETPGLVVHLTPLGPWIDLDGQRAQIQPPSLGYLRCVGRHDRPILATPVKDSTAVSGDVELIDVLDELLKL